MTLEEMRDENNRMLKKITEFFDELDRKIEELSQILKSNFLIPGDEDKFIKFMNQQGIKNPSTNPAYYDVFATIREQNAWKEWVNLQEETCA